MTEVTIEYCVPCGHLKKAIETQREILEEFGQKLEAVSLQPGKGGVFKIYVDDDLIWDKDEENSDKDQGSVSTEIQRRIKQNP